MRAPMENNGQWEIPNDSSERRSTDGREIQPCFLPRPYWCHNDGVDDVSTGNERHKPIPNSVTPVDSPLSSAPYLTCSPSQLAVLVPDPYPYPFRPSHTSEGVYDGRLPRQPNTITASSRPPLSVGPPVGSRLQWTAATGARKEQLNGGGDGVFRSSREESSSRGELTAVVDFTVQEEKLFRDEWRLCAKDTEAFEDHLMDALNRIMNVDIVNDCIDTMPTSCTRCRSDTAMKTDAAHIEMPLLVPQHYSLQSCQEEAITNGFHALGCAAAPNASVPPVPAPSQATLIDTISFRVNAIRWFIQHYEELTTQVSQIEYRQDCLRQQVRLTPSSSAISAGGSTMTNMNCNTTTLVTTSTTSTTTPTRGMKMDTIPHLGPRLSTLREEISPFLLQEVWPICSGSASGLDSFQVGRANSRPDANAHPVSLFPVSLSFFEQQGLATVETEWVRDTVFCSAARGALMRMLREIQEMVGKMQLAIQPLTLAIGFPTPSTLTPSLLPPSRSTGLGQPAYARDIAMANEVLEKMSSVTLNRHRENLERTVLKAHKQRQVLKEWAETAGLPLLMKREQTTEGRRPCHLSSLWSNRLQGFLRDIGGAHPELQWKMCTSLLKDNHDSLDSICGSDWYGACFHPDAYPLPPCPEGPVMAPKRLSRYHTQKSPPRRSAKRHLGSSTRNRNNANAVDDEDHCSPAQRSEVGRLTKWFGWWGSRKRTREDEHHKDKRVKKKATRRQPSSYPSSSSRSHPMTTKKRRERNDEGNSKKTTISAKRKSLKRRNDAFLQESEEVLLLTESESSREPSQLFSSRGSSRKRSSTSSDPKDRTLSPSESDCPSSLSREASSSTDSSDVMGVSSTDEKMPPAGGGSFTKSHSAQVNQNAVKRQSDEVGRGKTSSSSSKRSCFHKDDDGDEHEKVEFGLRAGTSVWRAIPAFLRSVKDRAISFSDSEGDETDSE